MNIENNIGKNSYRISDIKHEFVKAARTLEGEKEKYLKLSKDEIKKKISEAAQSESEIFTDKLLFLNQIYTSVSDK